METNKVDLNTSSSNEDLLTATVMSTTSTKMSKKSLKNLKTTNNRHKERRHAPRKEHKHQRERNREKLIKCNNNNDEDNHNNSSSDNDVHNSKNGRGENNDDTQSLRDGNRHEPNTAAESMMAIAFPTSSSEEAVAKGSSAVSAKGATVVECMSRLASEKREECESPASSASLTTIAASVASTSSAESAVSISSLLTTAPSESFTCVRVPNDNDKQSPASSSSSSSSSSSATSLSSLCSSSSSSSSNSSSPGGSSNSSPTNSPIIGKRPHTEGLKKVRKVLTPSLRSNQKRNHLSEQQLCQLLENYLIEPSILHMYGFPVESRHEAGSVDIYKLIPKHKAKEHIKPGSKHPSYYWHYDAHSDTDWCNEGNAKNEQQKSRIAFITPDLVEHSFSDYTNSKRKPCLRCQKMFSVTTDGEYLSEETCKYHNGKMNTYYDGNNYVKLYACCQREEDTDGCLQHERHIWSGLLPGMNGPYKNYIFTTNKSRPSKVYALDCEMCYTGFGAELTKITIIGYNGKIIYDHYVLPQSRIIDYCTRYSGVSESDLFSPQSSNEVKTFAQVQKDILELFDANTILIGHGLENDLRALRLVHKRIVDTSIVFAHSRGYPYRQSLKNLTRAFLKHNIQDSVDGHCSQEDALATLNLMLWKIHENLWQKEMRNRNRNGHRIPNDIANNANANANGNSNSNSNGNGHEHPMRYIRL